jgi:hypothetical protein
MMGSLSACLIYLPVKKYFDEQTGLFSAVLVAVCPILWEVDTNSRLDHITRLESRQCPFEGSPFLVCWENNVDFLVTQFSGSASISHSKGCMIFILIARKSAKRKQAMIPRKTFKTLSPSSSNETKRDQPCLKLRELSAAPNAHSTLT